MSENESLYKRSKTLTNYNSLPVSSTNFSGQSKITKKSTRPGRKPKKQPVMNPSTFTLPHRDAKVKANLPTLQSVPVVCGDLEALFFPDTLQLEVKVKGKRTRMEPREFEKLAGFGNTEKWKSAILVHTEDFGFMPIDVWLEERIQTASQSTAPKLRGNEAQQGSSLTSERKPPAKSPARNAMLDRMYETVGSLRMPLGVSDPDVPVLRVQRRKASKEHRTMIDYRKMTEVQLQAFLTEAPTKDLLFRIPRKKKGRKNQSTEDKSPEWKVETPSPAVVGSFGRKRRKYYNPTVNRIPLERPDLEDNIDDLLFEVLKTAQFISFRNFDLSLAELYKQVREFGGYEKVVAGKLWGNVAVSLDLVENGLVDQETEQWVENVYTQYLAHFNRYTNEKEEALP